MSSSNAIDVPAHVPSMLTLVHDERAATQDLGAFEPGGEYGSSNGHEFEHSPSGARPVWE
jgi:hypothetical protein